MAFGQSTITEVFPPRIRSGQAYLSWSSSSPSGTWYQVYVNQQLVWSGQRLWTWVPIPSGPVRVDIGTTPAGSEYTSFTASLPSAPARRVQLIWIGGSYESAHLAGYKVFGQEVPGSVIDYTKPLATITAYPQGIDTSGFGMGGWGLGGWGQAASAYIWLSDALPAGTWSFAVCPFAQTGNQGTAQIAMVTIAAPPRPPLAAAGTSTRLGYSLAAYGQTGFGQGGFGLPLVILFWNPSPT